VNAVTRLGERSSVMRETLKMFAGKVTERREEELVIEKATALAEDKGILENLSWTWIRAGDNAFRQKGSPTGQPCEKNAARASGSNAARHGVSGLLALSDWRF